MKKWLTALACIAVLLGTFAYVYREEIDIGMAFLRLKPTESFATSPRPAAPDYSQVVSWAALPAYGDAADVTPPGVDNVQAASRVDVFFVHPTTYFGTDNWNQSLGDAPTNLVTDVFVMRGQAAVFNSCCKIYAPRYRQASVYSFMDMEGDGGEALQLAYGDVERAFDHFIEHFNGDRPFILAAHSQGAYHLRTLLERRITGTKLRERLIAAYPIGFDIDREAAAKALPDIPVCASADQLSCMASWNTVTPAAKTRDAARNNICVNPLTWRTDGAYASHELNTGAVAYPGTFEATAGARIPDDVIRGQPILEKGVADAHCVDGLLRVAEIRSSHYAARPFGRDNYHVYDYGLFHMNLRANAELKARTWLEQKAQPVEGGAE